MPKQNDKYIYNDKQYIFIEYVSEQNEDGRIVEQVNLIDLEGNCTAFYLKKFFNENFTKVERTKKEKIAKKINNIINFVASSLFPVLFMGILVINLCVDIEYYINTETLLKEKNFCENVQNVIMKK
jgi:hypothetical protein